MLGVMPPPTSLWVVVKATAGDSRTMQLKAQKRKRQLAPTRLTHTAESACLGEVVEVQRGGLMQTSSRRPSPSESP